MSTNNKNLPSYEELFGNLDYSSADEYRSVLSPAAYLTDIMDLKEEWEYDEEKIEKKDAVDDRREDISEILLNAENTINEIPYLDIVNRIMENKISSLSSGKDAYDVIKGEKFPFNLPFNRYYTEIKTMLEYFKTSAWEFYKTFSCEPDYDENEGKTFIEYSYKVAREYLGLSEEEYQVIISSHTNENTLKKFYGLHANEEINSLIDVKRFRKATGLSALQVTELLFQNLSENEKKSDLILRLFLNYRDPLSKTYLTVVTIKNNEADEHLEFRMSDKINENPSVIPIEYFDRMHRFIRLSRKTGFSFSELDLILTDLCNGTLDKNVLRIIAVVKLMCDLYELPVQEICALLSWIKFYGQGDKSEPEDMFNTIFNKGYSRRITTIDSINEETTFKNRLQSCLGLTESEHDMIINFINKSGREKDFKPESALKLTVPELKKWSRWLAIPYRIKKLSKMFNISISSLISLFYIIDSNHNLIEKAKFPLTVNCGLPEETCVVIITGQHDSIYDFIWLIQMLVLFVQWLQDNDMTVEELEFICNEDSSAILDGMLAGKDLDEFLIDLNSRFSELLFKQESLISVVIDTTSAGKLFELLSDSAAGFVTNKGIIRKRAFDLDINPFYMSIMKIKEVLFIDRSDFQKIGFNENDVNALYSVLKNKNYIDEEGYLAEDQVAFFSNSNNKDTFELPEYPAYVKLIFEILSEYAKKYSKALEITNSECDAISEKISVHADRQRTFLYRTLESAFNTSSDIVEILCNKIFRTPNETSEMAVVNFMTPVIGACEKAEKREDFKIDASFLNLFRGVQRFALLASKTDLLARELDVLFKIWTINSADGKLKIILNDVKTFQQFKELCRSYNRSHNSILDFFIDDIDSENLNQRLSAATEWNEQDIVFLITEYKTILSGTDCKNIQVLHEMKKIFDYSEKMGARVSTLKKEVWDKIHSITPVLQEASVTLAGLLKSVMGTEVWKGLSAEIHNKMNLAKRDALLGYLIHQMEKTQGTEWIDNPRDLYEYLLIDVEMGEEATTSRIQEAIMCMQLFYHRTLINLEEDEKDEPTMKGIREKLKKWWIWMKNYRVWEANRKVFLYPENYIRPELRLDKSPLFKELEDTLLQGDVNQGEADKAFRTYLDKYHDISRLNIAGGYVYQRQGVQNSAASEVLSEKKIIMFGHTRTEPKKYYYMIGDIMDSGEVDWLPWKEVGIPINAEKVYPVYAFNRIFVFWVEVREKDQTILRDSTKGVGPDNTITRYEPIIYYTFYNLNKEWVNAQEMVNLTDHIDKLDNNKRKLFTVDKNRKGSIDDIPAKEVLKGAMFYVTNPITSIYYDANEFIYISYEVRYQTQNGAGYEFILEGKLKSNLEFEEGSVDDKIVDKREKNVQFPFDKFGITQDQLSAFTHWKGYFEDTFSAPWFSFDGKGGSFLCKPHHVPDPPQIEKNEKDKKTLFGLEWPNLPDAGFTDNKNRVHLFYKNTSGSQFYICVNRETGEITPFDEVSVSSRWGIGTIFNKADEGIVSIVKRDERTFMLTSNKGVFSYTGNSFVSIDQIKRDDVYVKDANNVIKVQDIKEFLPSIIPYVFWEDIKNTTEDEKGVSLFGSYLDNLTNAFVCRGSLYLKDKIKINEEQWQERYTCPDSVEFCKAISEVIKNKADIAEKSNDNQVKALAIKYKAIAAAVALWTRVDAAKHYTENSIKRLYITSGENVLVYDCKDKLFSINTIIGLTHPTISSIQNDTDIGSIGIAWDEISLDFQSLINRLHAAKIINDNITLFALKEENSYENTTTSVKAFFEKIASSISDSTLSTEIAGLGSASVAYLFKDNNRNRAIRFYIIKKVDGVINKVVTYDYNTRTWAINSETELTHPKDMTATVITTLDQLAIGAQEITNWDDFIKGEDDKGNTINIFSDNIKKLYQAFVWEGKLCLVIPNEDENAELKFKYTLPSAVNFWTEVKKYINELPNLTSIDSACIVSEGGITKLYVTSGVNVAICKLSTAEWELSTIQQQWGINSWNNVTAMMQNSNGTFYIFNKTKYATAGIEYNVKEKWGSMRENGVDSAFMDTSGKVYLFSGENYICYSNVEQKEFDEGYPKPLLVDFGIKLDDIKKQFSTEVNNVEINDIRTNTAFMQKVNGVDKLYLLVNVSGTVTRNIWKWRWTRWPYWQMLLHWFWWFWWTKMLYMETQITKINKNVYIRFSKNIDKGGKVTFIMDENYPKVLTGNWSNLRGDFNNIITATFNDKEAGDNGVKDVFYAVNGDSYLKYEGIESFPKELSEEKYEIIRLSSNSAEVMIQKLFMDGSDGLLTLAMQEETDELPRFSTGTSDNETIKYNNTYIDVVPGWDLGNKVPGLDFKSISGQYYWEIFFHAPFLIAQAFNNAQKFDEGNRWYEYVFDPTEQPDPKNQKKAFWKFLPFQIDINTTLNDDILNQNQLKKYFNDPFNPHAIARLRQVAYRKSIVMSYIDNLIDWGDMLFREYTRESINEARMLYVLAYDLLGKKPELLGIKKLGEAKTYKELTKNKNKLSLNMALIELENATFNATMPVKGMGATPNDTLLQLDQYGYFYIPENREFAEYWDRIEDRLHKIRYSLNIEGVKQRLPLFEPPIDVMALVRAVGSGMGLAQALADFNVAVPHYRFTFILAKARELTSRLSQFGQSLLSALEKRDAEELSLLRNSHEKAILEMTLDIKKEQLKDAEETRVALQANLKSAMTRYAHYSSLLQSPLSHFEINQIQMLYASKMVQVVAQSLKIASAGGCLVPQTGVATAMHVGGVNIGASMSNLSDVFSLIANQMSLNANLFSILGSFHRRSQDWSLQKNIAACDVLNIQRQIAGAEIKISIAEQEIEVAKRNIKNNESVDTFMKSKFTNKDLYRWMAGKLAGLYFQTYQMALDMAKAAQKSFQFELAYKESEVRFITSMYWDSLKKGLLAGETLQVDLDRMEKAYLEKNKRRFEISKSVSLLQIDPLALVNLREMRVCEFSLTEELFDYDFPGHYCRQIKSISITFPAVAGPYENINATLTQLSHRTLLEPDENGAAYLIKPDPKTDQPLSIRADWRVNQQIALSRGVNDSGLFQLNFQDERYLPFEGTGAVSTWRLELNGNKHSFNTKTISDVVIKVEYTALQGGDVFAAAVKKKLVESPANKMFNLSEDFSDEWNKFMEKPSSGLSIRLTRDMFLDMKSSNMTGFYMIYLLTEKGVNELKDVSIMLNGSEIKNMSMIDMNIAIGPNGLPLTFMPEENEHGKFIPENISGIAIVCFYEKKGEF